MKTTHCYVLYMCDQYMNPSSKILMGIFSSKDNALTYVKEHRKYHRLLNFTREDSKDFKSKMFVSKRTESYLLIREQLNPKRPWKLKK